VFLGKSSPYDLSTDPGETRDLASLHPERIGKLLPKLLARARLPQGGWRIGCRGVDPKVKIEGRIETSGRIVQAFPYELDPGRIGSREFDDWDIDSTRTRFEFEFLTSDDVDGLLFYVSPPNAEIRCRFAIDGRERSESILLGPSSLRPEAATFRASPESLRCPVDDPPKDWMARSGPTLAMWAVEGTSGGLELDEETRIDPETLEALRVLGYVD
jgi:hypothetical protein